MIAVSDLSQCRPHPSPERVKEVAEAGYDEVIFDASKLPLEENLKQSKRAVEIAKSIRPEILVEGETGYICSSSAILEKRPEESSHMTDPEEARQFDAETGIDVVAPAVGNMHGRLREMVSGQAHKRLDAPRIGATSTQSEVQDTARGLGHG